MSFKAVTFAYFFTDLVALVWPADVKLDISTKQTSTEGFFILTVIILHNLNIIILMSLQLCNLY